MTPAHLLSLADLHAAAPGVLDVVFGPDGGFDGAPRWAGPVYGCLDTTAWRPHNDFWSVDWFDVQHRPLHRDERGDLQVIWEAALDLRVSSVAARLVGLCVRASEPAHPVPFSLAALAAVGSGQIPPWKAEYLARMTLALAPRIAALRGGR